MEKSWFVWAVVVATAAILISMVLAVIDALRKEGTNRKFGKLPLRVFIVALVAGLVCVGMIVLFPFQNEEEAAQVREFVEENLKVTVYDIDTKDQTVDVQLQPGCIYTMDYIPAPNNEFAVLAGSERLDRTTPVFTGGGLAVNTARESCSEKVYQVPGTQDDSSSSTTTSTAPVAP